MNTKELVEQGRQAIREQHLDEAITAFQQAYVLFRDSGNTMNAATMLNNIGAIHLSLNMTDEAEIALGGSLRICAGTGSVVESKTLNNLGTLLAIKGRFDEARSHLERALMIKRDIGDHIGEGETELNLATMYNAADNINAAIAHAGRAVHLIEENGGGAISSTVARAFLQRLEMERDKKEEV